MPYHVSFAVIADSIDPVSDAIEAATRLNREGRESSYLGVYDLFRLPEKLIVKYNFVENEGEWDYPKHKDRAVLIVVDDTDRPEFFKELVRGLEKDSVLVDCTAW